MKEGLFVEFLTDGDFIPQGTILEIVGMPDEVSHWVFSPHDGKCWGVSVDEVKALTPDARVALRRGRDPHPGLFNV